MSVPNRRRAPYWFLIALFVLAVVAIPLAILSRSHFKQQAVFSKQQSAIEAIRSRGGTVLLKSDWPPDVVSVDFSRAVVDAELMQTLGQFSAIERLTLDGATLQPEDWALLGKVPRLQSLWLSQSNITDASVSLLPLGLTRLSLNGTAVTDKSMSRLGAMNGLAFLNIADTEVTPDGLRLLEPLTSLKMLWIAESCITAESAESLRLMQPQSVEVAVMDGLGRRTHELLSVCKGSAIRGQNRDGFVLWTSDSAWSHTLAGVFEAVVSEIDLDPQQVSQLFEILGKEPSKEGWAKEGWGPTVQYPPYSREEWAASQVADAFAVQRLLRICKDEDEVQYIRDDARRVLTEIAHRQPEYAAEAIPVLVGLPDKESLAAHYFTGRRQIDDILRLLDVHTDAAISVVPKLREMLKKLEEQLAGAPAASFNDFNSPTSLLHRQRLWVLEALSVTAHHKPELAHEIALEYLSRMEDGQPVGPFATLLSPDTAEANRMVVMALLRDPNVATRELASMAKKIRDWRTTRERMDE